MLLLVMPYQAFSLPDDKTGLGQARSLDGLRMVRRLDGLGMAQQILDGPIAQCVWDCTNSLMRSDGPMSSG
jgi:hypothetical protein